MIQLFHMGPYVALEKDLLIRSTEFELESQVTFEEKLSIITASVAGKFSSHELPVTWPGDKRQGPEDDIQNGKRLTTNVERGKIQGPFEHSLSTFSTSRSLSV